MPAIVVSQDPDTYSLNVSVIGFLGNQMPSLPVKVLTHGPRDAVRGHYPELPQPGTLGLIVFPRGDYRNGHWIGATDPALNDASAQSPGVGNVAYSAHYGGGWSWRGMDGSTHEAYPDGTTVSVGGSGVPAPTRHTVDQKGVRQRTAFAAAQRVPKTPSAFQATLRHPTGATASLDASGGWTLTAGASGGTVHMYPNGSVIIVPGGGLPVTVSGELRVTGAITAGYGTGDQIGVQTHVHTQGNDGHGDSEVPTNAPTPGS